jgi:hypothetical protein
MQMLSSFLCFLIGGFLLVTEALPLAKLTGSELLAAQLGESEFLLDRPKPAEIAAVAGALFCPSLRTAPSAKFN